MNKILPLVFALCVREEPVSASAEVGCSFSKKNKASQDNTIEQDKSSDSSDK